MKWKPFQPLRPLRVADASGKQQVWMFGVWKNVGSTDQSHCRQEPSIRVVAIKVGAPVLSSKEQWGGGTSGPGWKESVSFTAVKEKVEARHEEQKEPANQTANPLNPSVCLMRIMEQVSSQRCHYTTAGYISFTCIITFPLDWNSIFISYYQFPTWNTKGFGGRPWTFLYRPLPFIRTTIFVSYECGAQEFYHFEEEKECWIVR